jgi:hypothetical protein
MSSINKVIEGRAATVLQPEQDTPGQSRKTTAQEKSKTGYLCAISRQGRTYPESFDLNYKEGVAGLNPTSPTRLKDPRNRHPAADYRGVCHLVR